MILNRSVTSQELYTIIQNKNRKIRSMAWMLVLCTIIIGASAWGNIQRQRTIEAQDALIKADELRITNLVDRVEKLEKDLVAKAQETAVKTSRGADRTAVITAYTWTGQQTKSGTWPKEGRTCAGPTWVPFGTRVYIDGIGWRIVEDRTHERFDGRYDVYMDDHGRCMAWGKQERMVKFE